MDPTFWHNRPTLVTGGCGYIGSHLVRHLVGQGAAVRVADDLSRGSAGKINDVRDRVELIEADLTHPEAALRVCDGIDTVFHLAANAGGLTFSIKNQSLMFYQNAALNLHVLEAARRRQVRRVVAFSSSCVYPDDAPVPTPERFGDSGQPESGNRGYGWAKRLAEIQAAIYRGESDMAVTCVRPVNVFGEGEHFDPRIAHVIPALIMKLADAKDTLAVLGSGRQSRSFIYVRDLARIVARIAEDGAHLGAINVCSPDEVTIGQLARTIVEQAGRDDITIEFDAAAPEGPARKAADVSAMMSFLGDFKFTPLAEGIARMIEEHRALRA